MGTVVEITLPKSETPPWFVERILVPPSAIVVSADDDQTIHQIWAGRMASSNGTISIKHLRFSSLEQFENWVIINKEKECIYLVDYEFLGQDGNGLNAIERTGISSKAILVTSRFEDPHVRAQAQQINVRILPKALAPFVPIELKEPIEKYHAVILDDDDLVHMTWKFAAKEKGKSILCLSKPSEFFVRANEIHRATPLFIDLNLGDGLNGLNVGHQIAELGFSNIRLATGVDPSAVTLPPFVRDVVGKNPIF